MQKFVVFFTFSRTISATDSGHSASLSNWTLTIAEHDFWQFQHFGVRSFVSIVYLQNRKPSILWISQWAWVKSDMSNKDVEPNGFDFEIMDLKYSIELEIEVIIINCCISTSTWMRWFEIPSTLPNHSSKNRPPWFLGAPADPARPEGQGILAPPGGNWNNNNN